ncbi:MAG: mandelate racemase/muconate lactonizing enzyme family protein [Geminicoccaceae bacterium]
MTKPATIAEADFQLLRITSKTVWTFLRLATQDGRVGWGEATIANGDDALREVARRWLPGLVGEPVDIRIVEKLRRAEPTIAEAAFASSLDMALLDLQGQAAGKPIHALLGDAVRQDIPLYANINRRTAPRTPEGFAASAGVAIAAGYTIFKLAPFDEVSVERCAGGDIAALIAPGLARIRATREAIGPDATLRVDCHWRFDQAAAAFMIDACRDFALDWIECPVPEVPEDAPAIATLRRQAAGQGCRLAGLEMGTSPAAFEPFLQAGSYDVIMPDVKYLGGLGRFRELAASAARHGAIVSPHNPTGPVCHAASLHVGAVLPELDSLEVQFDETPLFDELVGGGVSPVVAGAAALPAGPGLGVAIDPAVAARLRLDEAAS